MVLAAADAVLVASGTAALEALLFEKPMLVCYRLSPLSYRIFKRKLKVPFVSLPNLLAGHKVVEELLQDQVQPQLIADHLTALLFDPSVAKQQSTSVFCDPPAIGSCRANTSAANCCALK